MIAEFKELWPEMGVDTESSPAAAMVPHKGKNFVRLLAKGKYHLKYDTKRLRVKKIRGIKRKDGTIVAQRRSALERDDPIYGNVWEVFTDTLCKFQTKMLHEGDLYAIEGRRKGMARIEVIDSKTGVRAAKLLVTVHPKREVDVTFHFVRDQDEEGRPRMRTVWDPSVVDRWLGVLNGIFTPQANIVLRNRGSRVMNIAKDYGPSIDLEEIRDMGKRVRNRSTVDVFLVGSFTGGSNPTGAHVVGSHEIVADDRPTEELQLQTISHEIGHRLGAKHSSGRTYAKRHWLMFSSPRLGSKITNQWAINMNPW